MSDGEAIYTAIMEEPGEDLHRLVFADWLEETSDSSDLAEFIRVQLELEKNPWCDHVREGLRPLDWKDSVVWKRAAYLHYREMQLLLKSSDDPSIPNWFNWAWARDRENSLILLRATGVKPQEKPEPYIGERSGYCGTYCPMMSGKGTNLFQQHFRRGFVSRVKSYFSDWMVVGKDVVKECPIEHVAIADRYPAFDYPTLTYVWSWKDKRNPGYTNANDILRDLANPNPRDIWYFLEKEQCVGDDKIYKSKGHDTAEEANASLSRACLLWAREPVDSLTPTS